MSDLDELRTRLEAVEATLAQLREETTTTRTIASLRTATSQTTARA